MRFLLLAALLVPLLHVPAEASDARVAAPLWKLSRGVINVVFGLPEEVVVHGLLGATEGPGNTVGSLAAGLAAGAATGVGWGVVRVGSGALDVLTFPLAFDRNRPLLEPEFAL